MTSRFALTSTLILTFSNLALAGDLTATQACLSRGYSALTNRHAIVAAVLDADDSRILTFGAGTEDQLFEIGSITKTFTANLLAQSILEGKIKLNDPIPNIYQKPGVTITYQHLTTHSSGIIEGNFPDFKMTNPLSPYEGLTESIFKDLYAKTPLAAPPGAQVKYSNIGVSLLGIILSENAGRPYEDLAREKIFRPLLMTDSYFEVPKSQISRFSPGYIVEESGKRTEMPRWDLYKTAINSAGGIRSSIGDMIKYARADLAPEKTPLAFSVALSHQPLTPFNGGWLGMNWGLVPDLGIVEHSGQTYGFNSILWVSKKKGQAIVALTDTNLLKISPEGKQDFDGSFLQIAAECIK